jgi:hypothetical protein
VTISFSNNVLHPGVSKYLPSSAVKFIDMFHYFIRYTLRFLEHRILRVCKFLGFHTLFNEWIIFFNSGVSVGHIIKGIQEVFYVHSETNKLN